MKFVEVEYELVVVKCEGEIKIDLREMIVEEFFFVVEVWFVLFYLEVVVDYEKCFEVVKLIEEIFLIVIDKIFIDNS